MLLRKLLFLLPVAAFSAKPVHAQLFRTLFHIATDTSYVSEHDNDLTVRPYLERNFNQFKLINTRTDRNITYQPNAPLQAGLGLSYRIVGIGLGIAVPYVNKYNKFKKGRITDLSSHFYLRRLTIDAYYQMYSGQHLQDPAKNITNWNSDQAYLRDDIVTSVVGLGFQYLLHPKQFSLEPLSFVHYQKKSAGSFIIGANITRTGIRGDSSIIPVQLNNDLTDQRSLQESLSWDFAISGGYAYTVVLRRHIFVTAALNIGAGLAVGTLMDTKDEQFKGVGILVNGTARLAAGYNSEYTFVGIQYIGYSGINQTPITYLKQQYAIGRINLTVAKRFKLKRKLLGFY